MVAPLKVSANATIAMILSELEHISALEEDRTKLYIMCNGQKLQSFPKWL